MKLREKEASTLLADNKAQTSVKFEAAPSPVRGERVGKGRVRGQ
jgi:hypothetical protein